MISELLSFIMKMDEQKVGRSSSFFILFWVPQGQAKCPLGRVSKKILGGKRP
jgi:hypothetical protein